MPHAYDGGGTRVCFPTSPKERRANEGPFARARVTHAIDDGARYEIARFDLPVDLPPDKRRILIDRVQRGIAARPGVEHLEVGTVVADGRVARVLSMRLTNQRTGKWLIFFTSPRRMLQVSVVGPVRARRSAERFLASIGAETCAPSLHGTDASQN